MKNFDFSVCMKNPSFLRLRSCCFLLVFGLVFCVTSKPALAWNNKGHMVVARIAWDQLDVASREKCLLILFRHPHKKAGLYFSEMDYPISTQPELWTFAIASTWCDWIRPAAAGLPPKSEAITRYHRGTWHYILRPYLWPSEADQLRGLQIESEPENIVTALESNLKILQNSNASMEDRAVALCWVLHLAGDIHQPLHCIAVFSKNFPPPLGDLGGGLVAEKAPGGPLRTPIRLHALWDDGIGSLPRDNRAPQLLEEAVLDILHDSTLRKDSLEELTQHKTITEWTNEGYSLAQSASYLDGKLPLVKLDENTQVDTLADLPSGYEDRLKQICRRRIVLAGYRLAELLKSIP